ncbi:Kinase family protein [Quillaja saponaria]|uniref:Kinase family protein n=1 Tax=Quillaja saponaria TaxID=32244 RepID=A0AAD7QBT4_QUISA|nr:Kinase family protein [Quillaja saponaria]
MTVGKDLTAVERKNVLVGINVDNHSKELLNWALVNIAEPGDCVIAVHVCRSLDRASKDKPMLDGYLKVYEGLCNVKKVNFKCQILKGSSIQKILVREAKNQAAATLVVGTSKKNALGGCTSTAKYCARKLPPTTDVLAIHNGSIVFRRCTNNQLPGVNGYSKPSLSYIDNPSVQENQSEFGDSEAETEKSISICRVVQNSEDGSIKGTRELKQEAFNSTRKHNEALSRLASPFSSDHSEERLGWPLLQKANSGIPLTAHVRKISVVQWVMSLPDRSPQLSPQCSTIHENPLSLERDISDIEDETSKNSISATVELQKGLEEILKAKSSGCKWFNHEALKTWTSQFSSENLIGRGGCNRVYKCILPDGKPVAVKVLQTSKEAWKDFAHEVEIISSLKHKNIMPLHGICIEDNALISVYDFFPKGNLEENLLHEKKQGQSILSWEKRFNVAVGVAEALNYLHNEFSKPVIHRDVKSSNILLSNGFEPQLSDFGLAIWGPTSSSFMTQDVVGTFGYLAPEYFMYGKVSDKIDVYAFGVVLLELISGRQPICSETPKGQESLVMWAKPIIESGDVKGVLDPKLEGKFDEVQMQRMVIAARLCITRAARLRPKISQILKILKGDNDVEKFMNLQSDYPEDSINQENTDDEVYPNSSAELHLSLALLDVDDETTSFSSVERTNSVPWEEYLKERSSRSSSFNCLT